MNQLEQPNLLFC